MPSAQIHIDMGRIQQPPCISEGGHKHLYIYCRWNIIHYFKSKPSVHEIWFSTLSPNHQCMKYDSLLWVQTISTWNMILQSPNHQYMKYDSLLWVQTISTWNMIHYFESKPSVHEIWFTTLSPNHQYMKYDSLLWVQTISTWYKKMCQLGHSPSCLSVRVEGIPYNSAINLMVPIILF